MKALLRRAADRAVAALVRGLFGLVRLLGPDQAAALGAFLARNIGPLLPVDRFTEGLERLESRRVFGKIVVTL